MDKAKTKNLKRVTRHKRIRARVVGTSERPRLSVFRSNKFIYAQLVDDTKGSTMLAVHDKDLASKAGKTKVLRATALGKLMAEKAGEKKIKKVVFDRGGFIYTGRVRAFAEGAREGGLIF